MTNSKTATKGVILVVDDEPISLEIMTDRLINAGFKIFVASSGEEALTQAQHAKPDLILLDVMMPNLDGLETCRHLKENEATQDIPVIFMSTLSDVTDKVKGFEVGGVDYITKSAHTDEIMARIMVHLALRQTQKELLETNEQLHQANDELMCEISERERAEEALRHEKALMDSLIDNIPDSIYFKDQHCRFTKINRSMMQSLNIAKMSHAIGKTDVDLFGQEFGQQTFAQEQHVIATGEPITGLIENRQLEDGQVYSTLTTKAPLRDANGEIVGLVGITREINELIMAQQNLRESEERYRNLVENAPVGIISVDTQGQIIDVNPMLLTILGSPSAEATRAINILTFPPLTQAGISADFLRCLEARESIISERLYKTKWGKEIYLQLHWAPTCDNGSITGVQAIVEDITERKQAEESLQQRNRELALINRASQVFNSTLELDQVLHTILSEMHHLLDITGTSFWLQLPDTGELICQHATGPKSDEVIGWRLASGQGLVGFAAQTGGALLVSDTRTEERHFKWVDQKIGMEARSILTLPLTAKDKVIGVLNLVDRQVARFTTNDLKLLEPIAAVATIAIENARLFDEAQQARDTAEQAQRVAEEAQRAAEEARRAAETANRAKSVFLANMSHELRTPLNGILGYAQILKRDKTLTGPQQESVTIVQQSGEHLLTLLNDILDLSKIEADKMELQPTDFHLPSFLKIIADVFRIRAEQKNIRFIYENLSDLPTGVQGDEKRLRQVLINLLGNAIKFTAQGGVTFKVGSHFDKIRFQVEDTGIGIKTEDLPVIFDPFRQVGEQHTATEGTGLGLSICKRLVEMMGGQLQVESMPGKGSTFWFDLELPATETWLEAPKLEEEAQVIGYEGPKRKVLVVDDNGENRLVLVNMLIPLGFEILEATDGQDGLTKAKDLKPDLILMDLVMPVLDGFEAIRQIRQIPTLTSVPIIAVSASAFGEDKQKSLDVGCNDFIAKPIHLGRLLQRIQTYLDLEWVYEQEADEQTNSATGRQEDGAALLVLPPPDEIEALFKLALRGDVLEIENQLAQLEQASDKYGLFVAEIRQLTRGFKTRQLRKLLEAYLEQPVKR